MTFAERMKADFRAFLSVQGQGVDFVPFDGDEAELDAQVFDYGTSARPSDWGEYFSGPRRHVEIRVHVDDASPKYRDRFRFTDQAGENVEVDVVQVLPGPGTVICRCRGDREGRF